MMMRFSLAVAVVTVGIGLSGLAQQNSTFKVKPSASEKEPKKAAPIGNAGIGKTTGQGAGSSANAKDLQALEHQTAKTSASRSGGKKAGAAPAIKPVKDKPNPPINFAGASGSKNPGTGHATADPYRGRLKQKHSHQ